MFCDSVIELKPILKFGHLAAVVVFLSVFSTAFADETGEIIFHENGCNSCHDVKNKSAGPSISEIITKYAGDRQAQAWLEEKVRRGGSGSFGSTNMPPIIEPVTDKEIEIMVEWILSQKLEPGRSFD